MLASVKYSDSGWGRSYLGFGPSTRLEAGAGARRRGIPGVWADWCARIRPAWAYNGLIFMSQNKLNKIGRLWLIGNLVGSCKIA